MVAESVRKGLAQVVLGGDSELEPSVANLSDFHLNLSVSDMCGNLGGVATVAVNPLDASNLSGFLAEGTTNRFDDNLGGGVGQVSNRGNVHDGFLSAVASDLLSLACGTSIEHCDW